MKRLYRTEGKDKMISGVCGGVAEYLDIDPSVVRIAFVVLAFVYGLTLVIYIIMAMLLPTKSELFAGY